MCLHHCSNYINGTTAMFIKKALLLSVIAAFACTSASIAQVSLDSCRSMAVHNNKQLRVLGEETRKAGYQKKEAFAAYLPALDFMGGYAYNSRGISIFDSDQLLPVKTFDPASQSYQFNVVKNPVTGEPVKGPDGQFIPESVALIPKEAMEYDTRNVFFGAVTLTQPVFMGGKIVAMNKITRFAEELAATMHDREAENIIYAVDAAYWQVVSLKAKEQLAVSYVALLDTLRHNVAAMVNQGVATESDLLTVDVKLNSARVDLTKVRNGLTLSRMSLARLCGLPVDTPMTLSDENVDVSHGNIPETTIPAIAYNMTEVYSRRHDIRALELGIKIREQQGNVARASMMPSLAVVGAFSFSNPNMFDGFKKRFSGMWSVGATLSVPLWHWGGNYNKYRAAKADVNIARLKLEDAKEMVSLQVSQASFKASEAVKTYNMTLANIAQANDNLRHAQLGYREGVMTTQNVLEAQTAWLKAYSEKIDAEIDVHLCDVYLEKSLGILKY